MKCVIAVCDESLNGGSLVIAHQSAYRFAAITLVESYYANATGYSGPKEQWRDGFERLGLGEKWIDHHGWHEHESTRAIIARG